MTDPSTHVVKGLKLRMRLEPAIPIVVTLLITTLCSAAWAQAPPEEGLPLLRAVDLALQQYPSLQVLRARGDELQAGIGVAGAAWYPSLHLTGSATYFQEPMLVSPIHGFTPDLIPPFNRTVFQGNLMAHYTLFDGGRRGADIRQARSSAAAGDEDVRGARQELIRRVVIAYLIAQNDQQLLDAHDRRLEALRAERGRAQQFFDTGRAAQVDVLRADATLSAAESERVQLAMAIEVAERDLARLTGLPSVRAAQLQKVTLAETAAVDSVDTTTALETNPEILSARHRAEAAVAHHSVARSQYWPDLSAVGNYTGWADPDQHSAAEWNAGVQLAYPLFSGGARKSAVSQAAAASRRANEEERLKQLDVEQKLDVARSRVFETRAQVQSLETAVARFTEVARIERLSLESGAGTQNDYLDAEADLLTARAQLIEARNAEIGASVEVARLEGQLEVEWLSQRLAVQR